MIISFRFENMLGLLVMCFDLSVDNQLGVVINQEQQLFYFYFVMCRAGGGVFIDNEKDNICVV
jgi:hypothetical protein